MQTSPVLSAPSPFSLIIFGASGHLAKIKLYPALYILALKDRLPKDFSVVGFARSQMDEKSFRTFVSDSIHEYVPEVNEKVISAFLEHVHYQQGDYSETKDFVALENLLTTLEKDQDDTVRLSYYSIPPSLFPAVSKNLCAGGVHKKNAPCRCIVEKPVGGDLKSFEGVKDELIGCFEKEDIYLLDHYLGKEAVRNVYYLRHANPVVERLFKHTLIDHVEITASENSGLEGRTGYFENTGTFRDMFQSHLLMVASLLTMQLTENEESIVHSRTKALKQFYLPPAADSEDIVMQGQYIAGKIGKESVPGYREEEGVASDSRTNTFDVLKLLSRASRWQGAPFYFRSGKRLEKKETRISIQFQESVPAGKGSTPNRLDIILQGEAGMRLHLQTKMGGTVPQFRPLLLEDPLVCIGDCLPEHSLLILEAIHGKRHWFLTFEEVQTAWRLLDPLQKYLEKEEAPLALYAAGTNGPAEADEWIKKDGLEWF